MIHKIFFKISIFAIPALIAIFIVVLIFARSSTLESKNGHDNTSETLTGNILLNNSDDTGIMKSELSEGLDILSKDKAIFLHSTISNPNPVYYIPSTGEIKMITLHDTTYTISPVAKIELGANDLSWSQNMQSVIAEYSGKKIYYNLSDGSMHKYNKKIYNPTLGSSQDKIAYIYLDSDTRHGNISVGKYNATEFKNLLATRDIDWDITWLDNTTLSLLTPKLSYLSQRSLATISTITKELKTILSNKPYLEVLWSPDQNIIAYSTADARSQNFELHILNMQTGDDYTLDISTQVSKCTWNEISNHLYCGIPKKGLTVDTMYTQTQDDLVRIDVSNENFSMTTLETTLIDIESLVLSPAQNHLLFINDVDDQIYHFAID
ncbi:MAG: hypothetical protein ABH833_02645 [Parcubacteria group bacterium]